MLYAAENYRRDVIPGLFVIIEADEKCKAMEMQVMKVIVRTVFRACWVCRGDASRRSLEGCAFYCLVEKLAEIICHAINFRNFAL